MGWKGWLKRQPITPIDHQQVEYENGNGKNTTALEDAFQKIHFIVQHQIHRFNNYLSATGYNFFQKN